MVIKLHKHLTFVLTMLAGVMAPSALALAQAPWHYTIGKKVVEQQSNFCSEASAVEEIARTFEERDPRVGYTALKQNLSCRMMVQSFTPLKVVRRVTISEGKPGEYQMNFVEVVTSAGGTEYLVTTRHVQAQE